MSTSNATSFLETPQRQLSRLIVSLWVPQAVHAAAELGIADALASAPLSGPELAARLGTHADSTTRLLHALAALGLLHVSDGKFALTEVGRCLTSDSPASARAWSRLMGGAPLWRAWGRLTDCIRTGKTAAALEAGGDADGRELFDAFGRDPEAAAIFHQAMADLTRSTAPGIVAALDLAKARRVVDLGGGYGALLCAVLQANPHLEGAVYDLEHARAGALALFAARSLASRANYVAGDLFSTPPPVADAYLIKSVIHDWDDERCRRLLGRCREVMTADARLFMIEPPVPTTRGNSPVDWILSFSDLNMLINLGGRERNEDEYRALLESSGLRVVAVRPTSSFFQVFEAVRAA